VFSFDFFQRSVFVVWVLLLGCPEAGALAPEANRISCLKMKASEIQMVLEIETKNNDARAIIAAYQQHQRSGRGMFKDMGRLDRLNLEINELKRRYMDLHLRYSSLKSSGQCLD
jgi:hypothetical protein